MLVGDVILSAREAVPDLPGVFPAPGSAQVVFGAVAPSPGQIPLPAQNYYFVATFSTPWGETSPGPEAQVVTDGTTIIQVTANNYLLDNVSEISAYMGTSAGAEYTRYSSPPQIGVPETQFIIDATPNVAQFDTPPLGNSAFLPDSGGSVAGAPQVFRWFQDALNRISSVNGGVPDFGGFGTNINQAQYTVPGDWQTLSDGWYDGYPLTLSSSGLVYRHNLLTSLSGMMSYTQVADTLVVELFGQPQRTQGVSSLAAAITPTSQYAQLFGTSGWVLPFGLAMIGAPTSAYAENQAPTGTAPTYEIVAYTMQSGNLGNVIRGLGGTFAQNWGSGTVVLELNCMFKGLRAPNLYSPGMSAQALRIPSSWVPLMHLYLLARYRRIEQQEQEAKELMQQFEGGLKEATKKKPAVGDRQVQPQDTIAVDVYPLLSRMFGGAIIP